MNEKGKKLEIFELKPETTDSHKLRLAQAKKRLQLAVDNAYDVYKLELASLDLSVSVTKDDLIEFLAKDDKTTEEDKALGASIWTVLEAIAKVHAGNLQGSFKYNGTELVEVKLTDQVLKLFDNSNDEYSNIHPILEEYRTTELDKLSEESTATE